MNDHLLIYELFEGHTSENKKHLALWCSRLARQPVTLEVDGSSPFGVAKKTPSVRMAFSFCFSSYS